MFRDPKIPEAADRTAEVAAIIAEEGLRYVSDARPGYTRKRTGTAFSYYDAEDRRITDKAVIRQSKSIGIPPAYERVWICPSANGHIQATGYNARGRKQYRYHSKWRELRDQDKYQHIMEFAAALPQLRRRVAFDLKRQGLPREKVLATVVSLLEKTLIRVGNAEYASTNKSYGLTTMRRRHVAIKGGTLRFEFTGKSGRQWKLAIQDRRIAAVVKRCAEIPGHELFKYLDDDGMPRTIDSGDVNDYIKEITKQDLPQRIFALGPERSLPRWRCPNTKNIIRWPKLSAMSSPRSRTSPNNSAILLPSAASAMCIPRSWMLYVGLSCEDDRGEDCGEVQTAIRQTESR